MEVVEGGTSYRLDKGQSTRRKGKIKLNDRKERSLLPT